MASDEEDQTPPAKGDSPESDEGVVLSPDELDFTNDERVVELDDGRYVISPGDDPPVDAAEKPFDFPDPPDSEPTYDEPPPDVDEAAPELTDQEVHRWLADRFDTAESEYGFDITAKFEGSVRRQELFSNDVVTTFENLLVWYAKQLGRDTPVEEVLGILLFEAGVPVRYPPRALPRLIDAYDLSPENTIADLLDAVDQDGGIRFSR